MKIGIDASRAHMHERTGIEEYSYQTIKNLRKPLESHDVVLYVRTEKDKKFSKKYFDFDLPEKWVVKELNAPRFWTQWRLSLELLLYPVDRLFIPAHTVPFIHPKKTIVTIHGLEYEFLEKAYSFWEKVYMRWSIRNSCKWVSEIISVSYNTKKDLVRLYRVPKKKISVIYEGYDNVQVQDNEKSDNYHVQSHNKKPFLLFIGRIEERKNIKNIIKAFEILKKRFNLRHNLILAGRPGYGYSDIQEEIKKSPYEKNIIQTGYVSEDKKWQLLKTASLFLFPTFYEGFGIPILEAQSVGIPVLASNNSSIPELVTFRNLNMTALSAILINPESPEEIASATYMLLSNENMRNAIIQKGYENTKRFSWTQCSLQIAKVLLKNE